MSVEILQKSFVKSGNTGVAVQLLKRGINTPEIKRAVRQHGARELQLAWDAILKAPTYRFIKYNPDEVEYPDGRKVIQGAPGYKEAKAEADAVEAKWFRALARATDEKTARFVVHEHYVHATTKKLVRELLLQGYHPKVVQSGHGVYTMKSESYGEYRYHDIVVLDQVVEGLEGSESCRNEDVSRLFGSSGSRNTWSVREDGLTVDVICWH